MASPPGQTPLAPAGNVRASASAASNADIKATDPALVFQHGQDAHEAAVNGLYGNAEERTGRGPSD